MKREIDTSPVLVPGVVSLAASSRRTLKHGDSFAMFDEFGDIFEVEHSPGGLFHHDTRFLSRLHFTLEGHRPMVLSSTVQHDNVMLDVDLTNPDLFDAEGRLALAKDSFHVARAKFLWQAGCYELFTVTSYSESRRKLRLAFRNLSRLYGFRQRGQHAFDAVHDVGGKQVLMDFGAGVAAQVLYPFAGDLIYTCGEQGRGLLIHSISVRLAQRRDSNARPKCNKAKW